MARMIPPVINSDCKSPGELEIFEILKNCQLSTNWFVLHSLDITKHTNRISGEIDFVIIIPKKGVLCVEVKACKSLVRKQGLWYYGRNRKGDSRGPFKQASETMHIIKNMVLKCDAKLSAIPFWSAVIFPYCEFQIESLEWHNWQVIDSRSFNKESLCQRLVSILNHARDFLKTKKSCLWFNPALNEPTLDMSSKVAQILRPQFEFYESPKQRSKRLHETIKHFTEEQFSALDAMESNPRVLFEGSAGTGKTLLAIETAKRSNSIGKKVLLLCYNNFLGKNLIEQTEPLLNVTCNTLHQYMLHISKYKPKDQELQNKNFWIEKLPEIVLEFLLNKDENAIFDELIIDEAQDFMRENYFDFLDLLLKGGLAEGSWRFFGDFENQTIYNRNADVSLEDILKKRLGQCARYKLRINCRNTPRVAKFTYTFGKLKSDYSKTLRPDDGVEPDIITYKNKDDQLKQLIEVLEKLYNSGYKGNDIIILSTHSYESCIAADINTIPWKDRIKPYYECERGYIGYCSIYAFKGLEAEVVILTDIKKQDEADLSSLFYVGASRSLNKVIALVQEDVF